MVISETMQDAAMRYIIEYYAFNKANHYITASYFVYKDLCDNDTAQRLVAVLCAQKLISCDGDSGRISLLPDGQCYFEKKAAELSKEKRVFSHDWRIAVFSALAGALLSEPIWRFIRFICGLFAK